MEPPTIHNRLGCLSDAVDRIHEDAIDIRKDAFDDIFNDREEFGIIRNDLAILDDKLNHFCSLLLSAHSFLSAAVDPPAGVTQDEIDNLRSALGWLEAQRCE